MLSTSAVVRKDELAKACVGCCVVAMLASGSAGCFSTRTVTAAHLRPLRTTQHGDDVALGHDSGVPVRLSPTAWVRFRRTNGSTTGWIPARRLRVDREMVWGRDEGAGIDGVRWPALAEMEVNDLDFSRTLAGTAGGVAVVAGAALIEVMIIGLVAGLTGGAVEMNEVGILRGAFDGLGSLVLRRPVADESFALERPAAEVTAAAASARPFFSGAATRRAYLRLLGQAASGVTLDPDGRAAAVATFTGALRLLNVTELGGGVRLFGTGQGGDRRWTAAPFMRLGVHLDVDAARRFAVFAGVEAAARADARLGFVAGVRWRPRGGPLQLGLYPMNPSYGGEPTGAPVPAQRTRRHFTTTLELAFVL